MSDRRGLRGGGSSYGLQAIVWLDIFQCDALAFAPTQQQATDKLRELSNRQMHISRTRYFSSSLPNHVPFKSLNQSSRTGFVYYFTPSLPCARQTVSYKTNSATKITDSNRHCLIFHQNSNKIPPILSLYKATPTKI